jgi:hypothetical protein
MLHFVGKKLIVNAFSGIVGPVNENPVHETVRIYSFFNQDKPVTQVIRSDFIAGVAEN